MQSFNRHLSYVIAFIFLSLFICNNSSASRYKVTRVKAPNGENMFGSEGYKQKRSALNAIESIKKNAPGAEVEEQTK